MVARPVDTLIDTLVGAVHDPTVVRTSSLDRRDTEQDARGAGTRTEAKADVRLRSEVLCGLLSCGF